MHALQSRSFCSLCGKHVGGQLHGVSGGVRNPDPGRSYCPKCNPGYFQTESGEANCKYCMKGSFRTATMNQCEKCPAGFHQNRIGQIACLPCATGRAADAEGLEACYPCPANTFSQNVSASVTCSICPVGRESRPESGSA